MAHGEADLASPRAAYKMPELVSFDSSDLPEQRNWKLDATYKLEITVKLTGLNKTGLGLSSGSGPEQRNSYEILSVRDVSNEPTD